MVQSATLYDCDTCLKMLYVPIDTGGDKPLPYAVE